jgi:hypothetical protein
MKAFVGFAQRRKLAGPVPIEGAAVDQQAADGHAMPAQELGGGMKDQIGAVVEGHSSARVW